MQESFQAGVDAIYNAIVGQGTTPAGKTPAQLATAIGTMATAKYNAGYSVGHSSATKTVRWGRQLNGSATLPCDGNYTQGFVIFAANDNGVAFDVTLAGPGKVDDLYANNRISVHQVLNVTTSTQINILQPTYDSKGMAIFIG